MLWDRPEETGFGLWGYAEPLVHHNARLVPKPVTKWRKTDGPKDAANVTKDRDGRDLYLKIWNTADNTPDDNIEFHLTLTNRAQL